MPRCPNPAEIVTDGRSIQADHHVRSSCGGWLTVWIDFDPTGQNGLPDVRIPRERIVAVRPLEVETENARDKKVKA